MFLHLQENAQLVESAMQCVRELSCLTMKLSEDMLAFGKPDLGEFTVAKTEVLQQRYWA